MPFYYRRSLKIIPGVKINFNKKSASITVGRKGARITRGTRGTHISIGIPGTGIYYRKNIKAPKTANKTNLRNSDVWYTNKSNVPVEVFMVRMGWVLTFICALLFLFSFIWSWDGGHAKRNIYITYDLHPLQWIFYPIVVLGFLFGVLSLYSGYYQIRQKKRLNGILHPTKVDDSELIANAEKKENADETFSKAKHCEVRKNVKVVEFDPMLKRIANYVISSQIVNVLDLHRQFSISFSRAVKIIEQLEQKGIVSTTDGSVPRRVLMMSEKQLEENEINLEVGENQKESVVEVKVKNNNE